MSDHETVGYLTWVEFERFRWAINDAPRLVWWLRVAGYIRGGDADELKHRTTDHPLGVPPTWLAAEEITRLMHELNTFPEIEDAANDEYGAWVAQQFTREVRTANAKWPFEDRPHNVQHLRCATCGYMSLKYNPPGSPGADVTVKCKETRCGAVMDEKTFRAAVVLIEAENNARRLGDRKGSREVGEPVESDGVRLGGGGEGRYHPAPENAVA